MADVVCLHGLGRTPADWHGVRSGLAAFGEVISPRLLREPSSALREADRTTRDGAIVVGHSMGGILALRLAQERGRPLSALVLSDCFFPPALDGRRPLDAIRDYGSHRIAFLREARSRAGAPAEATPRAGGFMALSSLIGMAVRRGSFDRAAGAVRSPVLVVHARDDHHVPVNFAVAAAKQHPGWSIELLDHGGHHAHVTDPASWLGVVVPWLTRVVA